MLSISPFFEKKRLNLNPDYILKNRDGQREAARLCFQ